ncbi:MAG: hypothetical protein AVDCRST_MAG47-1885, partial [uncultured Nocardioidaceae bacterium]
VANDRRASRADRLARALPAAGL